MKLVGGVYADFKPVEKMGYNPWGSGFKFCAMNMKCAALRQQSRKLVSQAKTVKPWFG